MRDRSTLAARTLADLGVSAEQIATRLVDMVDALAAQRRAQLGTT